MKDLSIMMRRLLCVSHRRVIARIPAIIEEYEEAKRGPYTGEATLVNGNLQQRGNIRSVYSILVELSKIIHESLYLLHVPRQPHSRKDAFRIYEQYLH
jgi:hypothetical protein